LMECTLCVINLR